MSCQYFDFRMNLLRSLKMLILVTVCFLGWADFTVSSQANDLPKSTKVATPPAKPAAESEEGEATAKTSAINNQRDPFLVPAKIIKVPKPVKVVKKPDPLPVASPDIETRVTNYKKLMRDYLEGRGVEPSKIAPYLIDELSITGIFRTEEGYGAFLVETATQKQQVFFARVGWQTHDGQIKEILPTGVKFIKKTQLDNGTVRQTEEFRALPAPNAK